MFPLLDSSVSYQLVCSAARPRYDLTMDILDLITHPSVSRELKHLMVDILEDEALLSVYCPILTPRSSNDDLNGSQHAEGGGTDFTYEEAAIEQLLSWDLTFGVYEYFSREGDHFPGHCYHGDGNHFAALVVNPPAYAATYRL